MHASFSFAVVHFCDCQQLHPVAEFFAEIDVERTDRRDAFRKDIVELDGIPNARFTRIASLCAVSIPPTSNVGSASA